MSFAIAEQIKRGYDIIDDAFSKVEGAYPTPFQTLSLPSRPRGLVNRYWHEFNFKSVPLFLFKDRQGLIILIMRTTTYFEKIRDSLIELVKKSSDTSDSSRGEVNESRIAFYREFLRGSSVIACSISRVQIVPRVNFKRSYAVYVINVESDVVKYEVKKRYTQFQRLYNRCSHTMRIRASFPQRTVFQAGWSEEVTSQRLLQLNKVIEELNCQSANELARIELLDFLDLYEKYQQERVEIKQNVNQMLITDEFLFLEMVKLNDNSKSMLEGFERIKLSISERKKRLPYEVAKQIMTGFQDYDGLISIVMNSSNELVIMLGLKLINWLISPQMNREYQLFRRIILKCIPNHLILQKFEEIRSHCELTLEYFKLLKFYLSGRGDTDIQKIAQFYEEGEAIEQEYSRWLRYNNMDSSC